MDKNQKYSKETIAAANNTDIVAYCQKVGIGLKQTSSFEYRGIEHDSLVINRAKNCFFWNSRQTYGHGALNFIENYQLEDEGVVKDKRFITAMNLITKIKVPEYVPQKQEKTIFKLDQNQFDSSFKKTWSYLVKTRGINSKLVNFYHQNGLIKQDKYGNTIFLWQDPINQKIIGASKQGTWVNHDKYGKRGTLKQIEKNSTYGYGTVFPTADLINHQKLPRKLIFFESSIDALSYYNCHPKCENTLLISMEGLKEEVFTNYLKIAGKNNWPIKEVALGIDNDEAGTNFINKIQKTMPGVQNKQPNQQLGKDWNDVLCIYRQQQERVRSLNQKKDLAKRHALMKRSSRTR